MKRKKYGLLASIIGVSISLFGCSAAFVPMEDSSAAETESSEATTEAMEHEPLYQPVPESLRFTMIADLEAFDPDRSYTDMDEEQAAAYAEEIRDAYDFIGRKTEDGYGYVLAFRNGDANPLGELSIYSVDDVIEAERWNEEENDFEQVYTFGQMRELYHTDSNDLLFFVPSGMEEPEELRKAFEYRFCGGEDGVAYLESVQKRGVRMSPPENGGYLAVKRFQKGKLLEEYIPLTTDQEKEITGSEEVIDPEVYGEDGIVYTASPEIYEEEDVDPDQITAPALKFAEESCEFQPVSPNDINDLAGAELMIYAGQKTEEPERGEKGDTETVAETLDDPEQLKKLETILSGAVAGEYKECPYDGVLTLTKTDGTKLTVSLASDECDTMVFGSYSFYQTSEGEIKKIWDLFPEVKKEIARETN